MKIVKYAFYRIYKFYEKKWPSYDPDIYAGSAVAIVLLFIIGIGQTLVCRLLNTREVNIDKKVFFPILIALLIIVYFVLVKNDNYKKYIRPADYEAKIFKGWRGDLIFWGFMFMPIIFIIIDLMTKRR